MSRGRSADLKLPQAEADALRVLVRDVRDEVGVTNANIGEQCSPRPQSERWVHNHLCNQYPISYSNARTLFRAIDRVADDAAKPKASTLTKAQQVVAAFRFDNLWVNPVRDSRILCMHIAASDLDSFSAQVAEKIAGRIVGLGKSKRTEIERAIVSYFQTDERRARMSEALAADLGAYLVRCLQKKPAVDLSAPAEQRAHKLERFLDHLVVAAPLMFFDYFVRPEEQSSVTRRRLRNLRASRCNRAGADIAQDKVRSDGP